MLRSALLVLSGNTAAAIMGLARNLAVASLIPVPDYGIAATFAVVTAIIEMATAFGLQQQIIQAKDGDDPALQAGLQGFQLVRGVIASVMLFVIASPMAAFLRVPEVTWAYQLMAVTPMLNALQHFDMHRLTRKGRFGPMILSGTLPAALSLAAIWPLAVWLGDFRVMLYAIIAQAVATAILSHLTAERRYRASLDRAVIRRGLGFGWPLMLNNILLFGVFNGDKLIIGRELGLEALAIFAMGLTLTLPPTLVLTRSMQNIFLPALSRAQGDADRFRRLAAATLQATALMGLALATGIFFVGEWLIDGLFAEKYAALLPLLGWLALVQALRMIKAGPATVALAVGETRNAMFTNVPRVALLAVAWGVAMTTGDLQLVILVGLGAEAIGLLLAFALLHRSVGAAALVAWSTVAAVIAGLGLLALWGLLRPDNPGAVPPPWWLTGLLAALAGPAIWRAAELRNYVRQHRRKR
ncbi:MAG: oligosaccharide flippase family protein [Gemmobacter sp.]